MILLPPFQKSTPTHTLRPQEDQVPVVSVLVFIFFPGILAAWKSRAKTMVSLGGIVAQHRTEKCCFTDSVAFF